MPLVDVTLNPRFSLRTVDGRLLGVNPTQDIVKRVFAPAIPGLLINNADTLSIVGADMAPEAVQVQNHNFGPDDVNTPDIWMKIQLTKEAPEKERIRIRDHLYEVLKGWFVSNNYALDNFVLDVFWCSTNGRGTVNGVELEW